MANLINSGLTNITKRLRGQGDDPIFTDRLSPTNEYYGFLSKVESGLTTDSYELYFECITRQWGDLVFMRAGVPISKLAVESPDTVLHLRNQTLEEILSKLNLTSEKFLTDGSWYELRLVSKDLERDTDPGIPAGNFYNPDIDFLAYDDNSLPDLMFGTWDIDSGRLIALPAFDGTGLDDAPEGAISNNPIPAPERKNKRRRVNGSFNSSLGSIASTLKRQKVQVVSQLPAPPPGMAGATGAQTMVGAPPPIPPPPQLPKLDSIGMMDVGMANCALLYDEAAAGANPEPLLYYDVGFPLFFYTSSVPSTLRPRIGGQTNAGYLGPVMNNTAANLKVYLSHWDWDHWRLGKVAGLQNLKWTYPNQPVGPSVTNFIQSIKQVNQNNANYFPAGTPSLTELKYSIYKCNVVSNNHAMIMNNSGLALSAWLLQPVAGTTVNRVGLTGDCNFNNTGVMPQTGYSCILAVHHGSSNNGAEQNLPVPTNATGNKIGGTQKGQIVYSYGITSGGTHAYGFPRAAAVTAYRAANWGVAGNANLEEGTAEGPNINANPPSVATRGNILVGSAATNQPAAVNTAFENYPNHLT